ncbi:MAG TPA: hypothetical protein VIB48_02425 [Acidimicrobiia bacterium]
MCDLLHQFSAMGSIVRSPRRRDHDDDDEIALTVQSTRALVEVVVPFLDAHLPPSHKRQQYEAWRAQLVEHWELRANRVRPCTVDAMRAPAPGVAVSRSRCAWMC